MASQNRTRLAGAVRSAAGLAVVGAGLIVAVALVSSLSRSVESAASNRPAPSPGASAGPIQRAVDHVAPSSADGTTRSCTRTADLDATGSTDVTAALTSFLGASPAGSVVCLAPGGRYRVDGQLHLLHRENLTIDGQGALIFAITASDVPRLLIDKGGSGIVVRNLTIEGVSARDPAPDPGAPAAEGNHGIAIGGASDVEIGPNVHISDVSGDGIYLAAGGMGSAIAWADTIRVHDSTIERVGRMGISITDGARNVDIERNRFDAIAKYVFDIEPNGHVFDGVPAGADHVRFSDNVIGTYGLDSAMTAWLMAGTGVGPETNVEFSRNVVTGGALRIGVWNVGGSVRANFSITDNVGMTTVSGPVMFFEGVSGLTVSGNTQPRSRGPLARIRNSETIGPVDP